ncbi:MAG: phosphate signaling complex protein PhoU [Streptococcaceae bacterium]|jgi:phosphate transport system protein|nr:phosphate signaling complex protein PhoU [Streptococcaceae bacterium]
MLRSQFEQQLTKLHRRFYDMGNQVSEAINKAVASFVNHDRKLAQEVIAHDIDINELEIKLEKKSFELIALQQPVTTDLRVVITIMKASGDLEHMGDHAVSIAKSTIQVKGETRILKIEDEISKMSMQVQKMVDAVLTAYIEHDAQQAEEIANWDKVVNDYYSSIYDHSIYEMQENPDTIVSGNDYLKVAGFLERIGDYVTNICEWIVYLQTGKISELSLDSD